MLSEGGTRLQSIQTPTFPALPHSTARHKKLSNRNRVESTGIRPRTDPFSTPGSGVSIVKIDPAAAR